MGDPRQQKSKIERPLVRWSNEKIDDEKALMKKYGLKRKKEILRAESYLREIRRRARRLAAEDDADAEPLLNKCRNIGLIDESGGLDSVLRIDVEDILDRRLQTIVSKIEGVKTVKQARQFIVHGHVSIDDRKVDSPSFFVPVELEDKINIREGLDEESGD